jgi:hypothetical protein
MSAQVPDDLALDWRDELPWDDGGDGSQQFEGDLTLSSLGR